MKKHRSKSFHDMSSYVELGILRVASVWLYNRPAAKSLTPFLEKVEDRVDYLAETLYCSLEEIMEPHWKNQREGSVYSYQEHKLRQEITSFLRCLPDQQLRNTVMIRLLLHSMEQLKYPIIPLGYTRLALDTIKSRSRSYFASSKQQQKEARMFTVKLRKILAGMDTYRAQSLFCLLQLLHYATSRSTSKVVHVKFLKYLYAIANRQVCGTNSVQVYRQRHRRTGLYSLS